MSAVITPRFEFERPASTAALATLLARLVAEGRDYCLSAGATDLMPQIRRGVRTPAVLVSLNGLAELEGIAADAAGGLVIGALTRLASVASHPRLRQDYPALAAAARQVASAAIRQRATLGGNLLVDNRCIYINQSALNRSSHSPCFKADGDVCHLVKSAERGRLPQCQARFVSDTAPVLLLLDARLRLASARGVRQLPLAEFYCDDGMERNVLAADEWLEAIELPAAGTLRVAYQKLAIRQNLDFPSLGVAVGLRDDAAGQPQELMVALTGVGTHPGLWRWQAGPQADRPAMLKAACEAATEFATTYQQDFFPRDYRKRMIAVLIRRTAMNLGGESWT